MHTPPKGNPFTLGLRPFVRSASVFLLAVSAITTARASDAELQSALRGVGCGSPSVKQLYQRGDITVFEANCLRSSHRVVTVMCSRTGCHVDEPEVENGSGER